MLAGLRLTSQVISERLLALITHHQMVLDLIRSVLSITTQAKSMEIFRVPTLTRPSQDNLTKTFLLETAGRLVFHVKLFRNNILSGS